MAGHNTTDTAENSKWPQCSPGLSCVVGVATHAQTLERRNEEWLTTR